MLINQYTAEIDAESVSSRSSTKARTKIGNVLISGVGFLADAYDLFVIDFVVAILSATAFKAPSAAEKSLIVSSTLGGAVLGQLFFGTAADYLGRRVMFVTTAFLVICGSLSSAAVGWGYTQYAASFSIFHQLAICRFILGLGIGGEYPLSATVASENESEHELRSNSITYSKGFLWYLTHKPNSTAAVFSMQGIGMLLSPLIVMLCITAGLSLDQTWRLCLGIGALPSAVAFYFRWKMSETAAFMKLQNDLSSTESMVTCVSSTVQQTQFNGENINNKATTALTPTIELSDYTSYSHKSPQLEEIAMDTRSEKVQASTKELQSAALPDQAHQSGEAVTACPTNTNESPQSKHWTNPQPAKHLLPLSNPYKHGNSYNDTAVTTRTALVPPSIASGNRRSLAKHLMRQFKVISKMKYVLLSTSVTWFLIDVTLYGTGSFKSAVVGTWYLDNPTAVTHSANSESTRQLSEVRTYSDFLDPKSLFLPSFEKLIATCYEKPMRDLMASNDAFAFCHLGSDSRAQNVNTPTANTVKPTLFNSPYDIVTKDDTWSSVNNQLYSVEAVNMESASPKTFLQTYGEASLISKQKAPKIASKAFSETFFKSLYRCNAFTISRNSPKLISVNPEASVVCTNFSPIEKYGLMFKKELDYLMETLSAIFDLNALKPRVNAINEEANLILKYLETGEITGASSDKSTTHQKNIDLDDYEKILVSSLVASMQHRAHNENSIFLLSGSQGSEEHEHSTENIQKSKSYWIENQSINREAIQSILFQRLVRSVNSLPEESPSESAYETILLESSNPCILMQEINNILDYVSSYALFAARSRDPLPQSRRSAVALLPSVFKSNSRYLQEAPESASLRTVRQNIMKQAQMGAVVAGLAIPGYILSLVFIHSIGTKKLQFWGFIATALVFVTLGLEQLFIKKGIPALELILFGLTFLCSNFGPNTTTFIIPTQVFPTILRATSHGFSAAMGKVGGVVGTSLFVIIEQNYGLGILLVLCGAVALLGALFTLLLPNDLRSTKHILTELVTSNSPV